MQTHTLPYVVTFMRSGTKMNVALAYDFEYSFIPGDFDFSGLVYGKLTLKLGSKTVTKDIDGGSDGHQSVSNTISLAAGSFGRGSVSVADDVSGKKYSGSFNIGYFTKATTYFGTSGANYVQGSSGADKLNGKGGNDALSGEGGNDRLDGGSGNDTLKGGKGIDILKGGAGNDYLVGGTEKDTLIGGVGNDTYAIFNKHTILTDSSGKDTVKVTGFSYTLKSAFENLVLLGDKTLTGIGNAKANSITVDYSSEGNFVLKGLDGNDSIRGNDGDDKLYGGAGNDTLDGGSRGKDLILGGAGDDHIYGGHGNTTLRGGAGNDVIWSYFGDGSTISGGSETDRFIFGDAVGAVEKAVITDYVAGLEKIDLRPVDADIFEDDIDFPVDDKFNFIGTDAFHSSTGELRYSLIDKAGTVDDRTVIEGDTNGDGDADIVIELIGLKALKASDFLL